MPKRLARRRPHARSSPVALWPGRGTMSFSVLNASKPPALPKRVPTRTSSSGKASTARRNWSCMMARSTVSRLDVRRTDASPMSTHGVPPMRSSVQNEKPLSLPLVAGLRDEHPRLGLLGQRADLVAVRALGAQVGHLGQLRVAQRRAVLGLDLDRHLLQSPRSATDNEPLVQSNGTATCNSGSRTRATAPRSVSRPRSRRVRAAPGAGPSRPFGRVDVQLFGQAARPAARRGAGTPATRRGARQQDCLRSSTVACGQQSRRQPDAQRRRRRLSPTSNTSISGAMSLGWSSRLSTRPFTTTTASSASLWPVLGCIVFGNTMTSIDVAGPRG